MKKKDIKKIEIFSSPKLMKILSYLYTSRTPKTVTEIHKAADVQYSYASKNVKYLRELKLIELERSGRRARITLTEKGKEIGKRIYEAQEMLR